MVEREGGELSLSVQAQMLGISRSSLYYHPVAPSPEEVAIKHRIDEFYTEYPFYGSRRMAAAMRREGVVISRKAVRRHMRQMGIEAIHPGPNTSKRRLEHRVYPYLLRGLAVSCPDHVWGVDITYVRLPSAFVYLACILDAYSRRCVGWALSRRIDTRLTLAALST
jgi:putative transposase